LLAPCISTALALNCAAIPEALLESELFGHERGSFTGADRRRVGKFEQCTGGTILLDEIGDMPLALQAKILRVLQEQTFQRVGGNEIVRTDVRVIASTHRDLRVLAAEGTFRQDLYYRLAVFTLQIPALRDRSDDLAMLAQHFIARFNGELGREVREIAPEALERLRAHSWPGNVRELQSVLKQALLRARGPVLLSSFLPEVAVPSRPSSTPPVTATAESVDFERLIDERLSPEATNLYETVHFELDRLLLQRVLRYTKGNQRQAARLLGISRQTIRAKLRAAGLSVTHEVTPDDDDAPGSG
jgi:DNA-binding NtrC family response regulator